MINNTRVDRRTRSKLAAMVVANICSCFFLVKGAIASDAATLPTSSPTTSNSIVPRIIRVPDGFVRIAASDRTAICEAADQPWVNSSLNHAPPGTQPSTRPGDLVADLHAKEESLESQLVAELDLKDKKIATDFVSNQLIPLADRLTHLRSKIVYLVITREDLKKVIASGWGGDEFHYNRVADKIAFNGNINVSFDGDDGESIVPVPFRPTDSIENRTAALSADISRTETGVGRMVARQSYAQIQLAVAKFIAREAILPLKLNMNQEWFSTGVINLLASQFMASATGADPAEMVSMVVRADPRNPVSMGSINLLNPAMPADLKPGLASAYADAFRRRSIGAVAALLEKGGPDAIGKTLAAIRAAPPADGPALVGLIQKTTGVDLTKELAASSEATPTTNASTTHPAGAAE